MKITPWFDFMYFKGLANHLLLVMVVEKFKLPKCIGSWLIFIEKIVLD